MAPGDEPFNFETIAQVYREERKSKTLTKLPLQFYKNLVIYMKELKKNYVEERSKDPMSPKTMMLEDEYTKAKKRSSQIYEHRERKILLAALSAANGVEPDKKFMTDGEKDAYNNIIETLSRNRLYLMQEGENDICTSKTIITPKKSKAETDLLDDEVEKNKKIKGSDLKAQEVENNLEKIASENPVLLILEDIPSFETEDGSFDLKKDDAISLSKNVAKILCEHKKARVIKG